jgi:hypothetical protein
MNYRCPVCNGRGKVESEFGGGIRGGPEKECPACKGTGMQYIPEACPKKPRPPQQPFPGNPWPYQPPRDPFNPFKNPYKDPYKNPFVPPNPFSPRQRRLPICCISYSGKKL